MKIIYFIIGWIMLILGSIGVILPVLPTAPFLLVATYCFAKSSKRFHQWFVHTKLYRNHVESFVQERAMTLKSKIVILSFASTMLLLAIYMIPNIYMRCFLWALIIFKYYYFTFRIKTIKTVKT